MDEAQGFVVGFPTGNFVCAIDLSSAVTLPPCSVRSNDARILDNQRCFGKSWSAQFSEPSEPSGQTGRLGLAVAALAAATVDAALELGSCKYNHPELIN